MASIWVARLLISPATAHKISTDHKVSADEATDALLCVPRLTFTWNDDPERGRRAYVEVFIRGQRYLAVLYPARSGEEDVWHLGSMYPVQ